MALRGPITGSDPRPASSALGGAAFSGRLASMAERSHVVMDGTKVRITVVVARPDMVDPVGPTAATQMTHSPMITQDALALRVPFLGEAYAAIRTTPAPGGHDHLRMQYPTTDQGDDRAQGQHDQRAHPGGSPGITGQPAQGDQDLEESGNRPPALAANHLAAPDLRPPESALGDHPEVPGPTAPTKETTVPQPYELRCAKCPETFTDLATALQHCKAQHGMTDREGREELRVHARCKH